MRLIIRGGLIWLSVMTRVSLAVDAVYVSDLTIYTVLAPCAADALANLVSDLSESASCGTDAAAVQSCICSSSLALSQAESRAVTYVASKCGTSALQDQASVDTVLSQYCNPKSTYALPTPTTNVVQEYISDLSALKYLPPCAQTALSLAVEGAGSYYCPSAASLYAPCVCTREPVTSRISQVLTTSIQEACDNNEDISAVKNLYHEYCAMNNGTTSFASPAGPPGDMTYYISAMPSYKSLSSCAQSGVSMALAVQTSRLCPSGPRALASCACLKSGVRDRISRTLTSNVKGLCGSTAAAQVTPALDVLDVYCRAAANQTSISVAESISETSLAPKPSEPTSTDVSNSGNGDSKSHTGVIVGSVIGGVVAVLLVGAGFWFWRHRKKNGQPPGPAYNNHDSPGIPEAAGVGLSELEGFQKAGSRREELSPQLKVESPLQTSELPASPYTLEGRAELP